MSLPVWPPSLPQSQFMGLREETEPNTIFTRTDSGPGKIRRRSTVARRFQSTPIELTATQLATFRTFFETTLNHGTGHFTWTDFITGNSATFRFREGEYPSWMLITPALTASARRYSGVIDLEVIPD